jgi:hypothetical protein
VLFDPRAHEPVLEAPWDRGAIEDAIRAIAREADGALRDRAWWPIHPLDAEPGDPEVFHGVYLGAAGVVWALDRLARAGLHEPGHDYSRLATDVLDGYERRPEFGLQPSLWLGLSGIALVAWLLAPSAELADRLEALVTAELQPDTLELLWGSPGLLFVADALLERTGEPRWSAAWSALAERLLEAQGENGLWTQDLYGKVEEIIGAGHGTAGIVAGLSRRPDLLPPLRIDTRAFVTTAVREGAHANWSPALHEALVHRTGTIRVQWCHGAPGIVTSLAALPSEDELDELLLAGGELTWAAGPLRKGAGLCHGTAGNGFAFLKLFARTGDEQWLERARRFATHAAAQVAATRREHGHGRHTLWTGDLGAALYLRQCITGEPDLPGLESW